jgi:hypothetical protein
MLGIVPAGLMARNEALSRLVEGDRLGSGNAFGQALLTAVLDRIDALGAQPTGLGGKFTRPLERHGGCRAEPKIALLAIHAVAENP